MDSPLSPHSQPSQFASDRGTPYTNRVKHSKIILKGEAKIKIYSPICTVCQYMKQNRGFTKAVILSTYFDPNGAESLRAVCTRFLDPVPYQSVAKHAQRHMKPNIYNWRRVNHLIEKSQAMKAKQRAKEILLESTMAVVETVPKATSQHEEALDLMIQKGVEMVNTGAIRMTAQTLNAAIKTKADIESKTKDRRFDALKTIFAGAAPKDDKTV